MFPIEGRAQRVDAGAADPADGRLQAEDAAQRSRDAHRSARVRTKRQRDKPGGHGNTRTAARSVGRMRSLVPGIVRRAVVVVDPDPAKRELDGVRLPDEDHPRRDESAHRRTVGLGDVPRQHAGPCRRRQPGDVVEVRHGERDAVELTQVVPAAKCELRTPRLGEGTFASHGDECVQPWVERRDSIQPVFGKRDGTDIAAANARRKVSDGGERERIVHMGRGSRVSKLAPSDRRRRSTAANHGRAGARQNVPGISR